MICPSCGKDNKNTNIRCEFCSSKLIDVTDFHQQNIFMGNDPGVETKEVKISIKKLGCLINIFILIFVGPWLLVGMAFLGVGLFSSISEYNQTKGYKETAAILKSYKNCSYDDGSTLCEAIYEYQVDGITYSVSPDLLRNRSGFDERETVYYNPNNPSESLIYAGWNTLVIRGFIIVSVVIIILIVKTIIMKKKFKGKDNITINVYKKN